MTIHTTYSRFLPEGSLAAARAAIAERISNTAPLTSISDADAALPTAPGKWTRKELLGHLVDSALNNTHRFVRGSIPAHWTDGVLILPGYEQNDWVRVSNYQARSWKEIIDLWVALNQHILHVIDKYDAKYLATPCIVGTDDPLPIEHLIVDYAGHFVHHYNQITQ